MTLSRRALVHLVGKAGGVAAAFHTMAAMGLLAVPSAYGGPPALPPGRGRQVVIIGAGIAGMVLGFELRKSGYRPLLLEARPRPGGRNWSLRGGDTVAEPGFTQHVTWDRDDHLYFNPGPARIPYHHEGILDYCRTLGVPLEVLCNDNRAALMQDDQAFAGAPQLNRRVVNDARGYVAELAAKAVDQNLLSQPVSTEDKERLRAFLRGFGALDDNFAYHGSARTGWSLPPDATQSGTPNPPLDLDPLLASDFWQGPMQFGEFATMAATMMQPVGGMGRIGEAFGRALEGAITFQAIVTKLERTRYRCARGLETCLIRNGASDRHAVCRRRGAVSCAAGHRRGFYSGDPCRDGGGRLRSGGQSRIPVVAAVLGAWIIGIYGGISWTSRDATQIWYPSAGLQKAKGILVGAYIWSADLGNEFAANAPAQRLSDTSADVAHLHPEAPRFLEAGVSVAWKNIPYSRGGWAEWSREARANGRSRCC